LGYDSQAAFNIKSMEFGAVPLDRHKNRFHRNHRTGLSLVAIVVGGLMFAYDEGQSKKTLAGIVFGVGMAIGAVNF
jgi:hypothetical protein